MWTGRLAAVVLSVVALASPTLAEPATHVVVAGRDRVLAAALGDAFAPSGMTVVEVADAPPGSIAELAVASRALADREQARSVVWLIVDPGGATLVTYDREVDRVLVRTLPYAPPLTAARAAETARMARTMLRALQIPDEPEPITAA
ncbi:MAG: hypothetical protein H0X17_06910, partial [Deltaproteobacteria bacterium]|nr:hypothetical protein [Deltaproteobacteria bacterium]